MCACVLHVLKDGAWFELAGIAQCCKPKGKTGEGFLTQDVTGRSPFMKGGVLNRPSEAIKPSAKCSVVPTVTEAVQV